MGPQGQICNFGANNSNAPSKLNTGIYITFFQIHLAALPYLDTRKKNHDFNLGFIMPNYIFKNFNLNIFYLWVKGLHICRCYKT